MCSAADAAARRAEKGKEREKEKEKESSNGECLVIIKSLHAHSTY
jgi:hypothetical protein